MQSPTTGPNRYFQHCIKNLTDRVKAFVERNTKPIDLFNLTPEDFAGNLPGVTVSAIVGGILGGIAGGLGGAALGALGGAALGYVASLISVWSLRILGQFVINQAVRTAAIARLALGIGSCITYPGDTPLSRP